MWYQRKIIIKFILQVKWCESLHPIPMVYKLIQTRKNPETTLHPNTRPYLASRNSPGPGSNTKPTRRLWIGPKNPQRKIKQVWNTLYYTLFHNVITLPGFCPLYNSNRTPFPGFKKVERMYIPWIDQLERAYSRCWIARVWSHVILLLFPSISALGKLHYSLLHNSLPLQDFAL